MHQGLHRRLDPGRTAMGLAWIGSGLLLAHLLVSYLYAWDGPELVRYRYIQMFDLDKEEGFGTWFAAVTLLFTGRILLVVARDSRQGADGLFGRWLFLAVGFHILSIDEVAGMHEFVNSYGDDLLGLESGWTTYAMGLVAAVFVVYLPFVVTLFQRGHRRTVVLFAVAGLLYVGGAVGVEKMGPDGPKEVLNSLGYMMGWVAIEEALEMAGVLLMIYALLDYLRGDPDNVLRVTVEAQAQASE